MLYYRKSGDQMSNHLKNETSPYLLQHAENPVNWYPWGDEAFQRAKQENKPIFLSIGYSTCHWCHVMAHESFEDKETASVLNEHFISIKVDREERPDIDSVYMAVCQTFTGSGGWPASIFMTPEQKPFYAGTYFPVRSQYGMIGFRDLLTAIADKWMHNRSELLRSADAVIEHLKSSEAKTGGINPALAENAAELFSQTFDSKYGGFGDAPKFPSPHNLLFLLAYSQIKDNPYALFMVETTLTSMRKGGIFDHIGYGFSRYSTDRYFLSPHFEKMLYDNALLILTYTATYIVTRNSRYLDTAEKTADYVLREMVSPQGGFYSAQDADSDGVEGKYYLFRYDEILSILGEDTGKKFNDYYGITRKGNFEGYNIPNRLHANKVGNEFDNVLPIIYEYRRKRERLHLDDKVLTSWNALMISAFALLYRVTGKDAYLSAAQAAQRYIEKNLSTGNNLFVSCRDGKQTGNGFLDDYAFYTAALLGLYEASKDDSYLKKAESFCREAINQFADEKNGGFYLIGKENEPLVLAPKETYDGAMPCGNSIMAYNLVRISQLTNNSEWEQIAQRQLAFLSGQSADYPAGHSMFLLTLLLHENPPPKITVVLSSESEENELINSLPLYADVTVLRSPAKDYKLLNGQTTYYVCRGRTCLPPSNTL